MMTTYLLSFFGGCWHLHCYDDEVSLIAAYIYNERDAIEMAMGLARQNRPSQVMRTLQSGESSVLGVFESSQ